MTIIADARQVASIFSSYTEPATDACLVDSDPNDAGIPDSAASSTPEPNNGMLTLSGRESSGKASSGSSEAKHKRQKRVFQRRTVDDDQNLFSQPPGIDLDVIQTYTLEDETTNPTKKPRIYVIDCGANSDNYVCASFQAS